MTSFIKQKTATFSRPRIIVKYMDTLLTSKPLTTATPVDGYAIVDGDIVLFTNLSAINYTIHRATVTGVNITWTQLALGQSADGLPTLGDEVFIQAGTYTKKIYWYDGVSFIEFKSGGGIGDSSIFGYLNSQDDNITTQAFTTGNNPTFLTAGVLIGIFNQKNKTNPLNGKSSYTYTQGATSINDWIASYAITVPLKAKGVTNVTKFSYMYDGGNNDILPVVYDVTNSKILSSLSKFLENTNGVSKRCELVYDVPSTCSSIKIGFHVKVTNNGKILKFDDIETGVWTSQAVNLVEQESVRYIGANLITTTGAIRFNNAGFNKLPSSLYTYDSATGYFTPKKKIVFSGGASLAINTNASVFFIRRASDNAILGTSNNTPASSGNLATLPFSLELNAGESIIFSTTATLGNNPADTINITASAISGNVVQSWQPSEFLGEIKLLPSTTAPKGFIPADGKSIGKSSGTYQGDAYYALYAMRWTTASTTAGEPYVISSAKGASAQADWDAGKTITIDVRGMFFRASGGNAGAVGTKQSDAFQGHWHEVNKFFSGTPNGNSGGIGIAAAYNSGSATGVGSPVTDGTNGTPRVASETRPVNTSEYAYMRYGNDAPTLLALPAAKQQDYYIEAAGNAGQTISALQDIPYILNSQNNSSWDGTGFIAPIDGWYSFDGGAYYTTSAGWNVLAYVNGNLKRRVGDLSYGNTFCPFSGKIYLLQGQRLSFRGTVGGTVFNDTSLHYLSITRLNGKNDSVAVGEVSKDTDIYVLAKGLGSITAVQGSSVPLTFTSTINDTHTSFNGRYFTAPYSGYYTISGTIAFIGASIGNKVVSLCIDNVFENDISGFNNTSSGVQFRQPFSRTVYLNKNQKMDLRVFNDGPSFLLDQSGIQSSLTIYAKIPQVQ